jgi:hypothetical protein
MFGGAVDNMGVVGERNEQLQDCVLYRLLCPVTICGDNSWEIRDEQACIHSWLYGDPTPALQEHFYVDSSRRRTVVPEHTVR